jgi:hypothetical protein
MAKMASLDAETRETPETVETPVEVTVDETPVVDAPVVAGPATDCVQACDLHDNYCQTCGRFVG